MYDAEIDVYICPASRELYCIGQETNKKARKNYDTKYTKKNPFDEDAEKVEG